MFLLPVHNFLWVKFNIQLWLSGMSCVKCFRFSNILTDTAVAIFRVNVYWGFRKPHIQQAVGGKWDVEYLTRGADSHSIGSTHVAEEKR
jgi:hypothetical protein